MIPLKHTALVKCNSMRDDLIIYVMGHTVLTTQQVGTEMRHLVTNGKKLEKIHLLPFH